MVFTDTCTVSAGSYVENYACYSSICPAFARLLAARAQNFPAAAARKNTILYLFAHCIGSNISGAAARRRNGTYRIFRSSNQNQKWSGLLCRIYRKNVLAEQSRRSLSASRQQHINDKSHHLRLIARI